MKSSLFRKKQAAFLLPENWKRLQKFNRMRRIGKIILKKITQEIYFAIIFYESFT